MNKTILLGLSLFALGTAGEAMAEMRAPTDPMGGKTITRAEALAKAEAMFTRLDVNHDGKLDEADKTAHLNQRFDAMDADHNGSLSRDEFIAAHAKIPMDDGPPHGGPRMGNPGKAMHEMGMMYHMADTNGDGAVSKDEFIAAHLKMFDQADSNHDGKLIPAERKAFRQEMKKKMGAMHRGQMGSGDHAMPMPSPPQAN